MGYTLHPTGFDVSTVSPCIAGIVQDLYKAVSNQNYAAKAAVNIMQRGGNPFDVYKFFQEIYNPDSRFVIKLGLADLPGSATGTTEPWITNMGKERVAYVFIDKDYVKTATDLSLARTILHESIHAMILFGQKNYLGNDFKELNQIIFTPSGLSSTNPDDHHEQMASTYINEMRAILGQFAKQRKITEPTSLTMDKYLEYLSWGGLTNTKAWDVFMKGNKSQATSIISREANRNNTNGSRTSSC